MGILTVASQKGGVGKTTTVLNLGYTLARLGNQVLLVDVDPQGGMALASNLKKRTELGLIHLLRGTSAPEEVIAATRDGVMSVVGSGISSPADIECLEEETRNGRLGPAIKSIAKGFDYVFLDPPAGVGGIVTSLLGASDGVILMLRCRSLVLKSLPIFLKLLGHVRSQHNPQLRLEGALVTMWDPRNPLEQEVFTELTDTVPEGLFFRTLIPYDDTFETASMRALPMLLLEGARDVARPYLELAMELKEREVLRGCGGQVDEHVEGLF